MDISAIKLICIDLVQVDPLEVANFIRFNLMKHSNILIWESNYVLSPLIY